jgi:hypothetical protein
MGTAAKGLGCILTSSKVILLILIAEKSYLRIESRQKGE